MAGVRGVMSDGVRLNKDALDCVFFSLFLNLFQVIYLFKHMLIV